MPTATHDPLTPRARRRMRASLAWAVAALAVLPLYILVVWLNEVVNYAAMFGVPEHHVWVFLSEVLGVPVFLAFHACWGLSLAYGLPVAQKRPVCLVWLVGVPLVVYVGAPLAVVVAVLAR